VASDGSAAVAKLVTTALRGVSVTLYGLQMVVTLSESEETRGHAESMLEKLGPSLHLELTASARPVEVVSDKRSWGAFEQVREQLHAAFARVPASRPPPETRSR